VATFQVTDQNAIESIQVVIKDDGNPRPFSIIAKNLATSHDRDNFAGILISDEILCHVSLGPQVAAVQTAAPVSEGHLRREVVWGDAPDTASLHQPKSLGGGLVSRSLDSSA
jgi:hypothetical protein